MLAACIVSAGNAMIRYAFGYSSNGWLELQWYMFAILVMFGASYTFKRNEHVRVEIFYLFLSERGQLWLDLIGTLFFLIPACLLLQLSVLAVLPCRPTPWARSPAMPGGLVRWPIKIVVPAGFVMLALQGVSEVIKRIAALQNLVTIDAKYERPTPMITLEMMPPLMFGGLVLAMLIGFPVAFTLAAVGLSFGFLVDPSRLLRPEFSAGDSGPHLRQRAFQRTCCSRYPSSRFMGAILERCGLAEDMLDLMGQLFGPIRGGLGYSVIIVGFILGAITGTVAAQVIAMALISMPVMIRYGYNIRYITGVLAASGHDHAIGAAVAGAHRAGRPARQVGRRHVSRAHGDRRFSRSRCSPATHFCSACSSRIMCRRCRRRALTLTGWPLWQQMPAWHHPFGGADLRRARHHDDGSRDADRSRRHGRGRRDRARRDPPQGLQHDGPQDPDRRRRSPPVSARSSASL